MILNGSIEILAFVVPGSIMTPAYSQVYLPLSPGVTALYGLNGSGKSLILEGLKEALTGNLINQRGSHHFQAQSLLYVRAKDSAVQFSDDMADLTLEGNARGLYEELSPRGGSFFDDEFKDWAYTYPGVISKLRSDWINNLEWAGGFPDSMDPDKTINEVLSQKRFLMRPAQVKGNPYPWRSRWRVQPAFVKDANLDEVTDMLDMVDQGIKHVPSTSDTDDNPHEGTEFAVKQVALPSKPEVAFEDSYQGLYQLDTPFDWKATLRPFAVMGNHDFDPNQATREFLDHDAGHTFRSVIGGLQHFLDAVDEETMSAIRGEVPGLDPLQSDEWICFDGERLTPDSGIMWFVEFITWRANRYYSLLLANAPTLQFDLESPNEWFKGKLPLWSVAGPWSTYGNIYLESLSSAERRWASIAIELAINIGTGGFFLIDEPEAALHRSAEQQMAKGLMEIARERDLAVIVATHSPEIIDAPGVSVQLVRRADQMLSDGRKLERFLSSSKIDLKNFGLLPSDLLRRQSAFLLVEGQHDLVILESLVGEELRRLKIEMIPMRGASQLPGTVDSRVLYDFTDAHVFVLLDALDPKAVHDIWEKALQMVEADGRRDAIDFLGEKLKALKIDESRYLAGWGQRALETELEARLTPLVLSKPDIVDYLPVADFVANAESWESLRSKLNSDSGSVQSGSKFKSWLKENHGADLADKALRESCRNLDHIPADITRLLNEIEHKLESV